MIQSRLLYGETYSKGENRSQFDVHIQNAVSKANRMIGILRHTFTFLEGIHFCSYTKHLLGCMLTMAMLYDIHI